ncbi:putative deoxyribonuclease TATDN3 isoform X2 [Octopus sinensis]|uniref:Deoxyribonuclease TATDN3 isoform X2 n=1 Tax=Octopus sinensis TaxID=2607531 RepID=A0A6P7THU1_9MOLL|nr:putative deoxyribonuclease TATDN3 isoform X2 [Octopus sinensis]
MCFSCAQPVQPIRPQYVTHVITPANMAGDPSLFCIDAHCHLADSQFTNDIESVIERALKAGVKSALCVAIGHSDFEKIISLNKRFPDFVVPCLGVHPVQEEEDGTSKCVTNEDLKDAIPLIEKYHDKIAAIGEVGLDFTPRFCKSKEDRETQRQILASQVEIAKKYNLPLNVHSRSAGRPTISLLKELGAENVLLHAFDGRPSIAMEGVKAGFYFSIPPSIVRSEQEKLVKQLPLDCLLLESDSPALAPQKQMRNEPQNIQISAEYIARIKGTDVSHVCEITTQNAFKLFPRLKNFLQKL